MHIQCPNCTAKLQLAEPKPGRYKLACKKCGQPFLIQVSNDSPLKVRVGKIKSKSTKQDSKETPTQRTVAAAASEQTLDQTMVDSDSRSSARSDNQNTHGSPPSVRPRSGTGSRVSAGSAAKSPISPQQPASRQHPASRQRSDSNPIETDGEIADGEITDGEIAAPLSKLGGYKIIRMLGRGAMGAVYQAKQTSLDRDVALKTIRGRLAENPASLARFTREAYAAAQLTHHNVVQIYDFGEDDGLHYFSMEWVRGGTLSDLVREKGSLDSKMAATYILQACRGLQFAHRSGMVHRDVKPANLLLSDEGVVKVADLGLVKVPDQIDPEMAGPVKDAAASGSGMQMSGLQSGTQVTMQGTAVGTPAYMAPEQSADASTVDHRADIYSLGCSLFYLLAGRSPYDGSVVSEVIEQHTRAPLPNLSEINARVPEKLNLIVKRAMAKRPSDRYGSLAEMIDDLQSFLGVESLTGFSPTSDQADRWETIAAAYGKTQLPRKISGSLFVALAAVSAAVTLLTPLFWPRGVLLGPVLFITANAVAITLGSTLGRNAVADHVRKWWGVLSWFEIASGGFAIVAVLLVSLITGLWAGVLLGLVLGAIGGAAYHFSIALPCKKSGQTAMDDAKRFVRNLRLEGADENGLRDFLARYAAKDWQLIFESLFGYEALVEMRSKLEIDTAFDGPTSSHSVRDRICNKLNAKIESKREVKNKAALAKVEQRSLIAQGISQSEAVEKGWQMASAIMETANLSIDTSGNSEQSIAQAKRKRIKAMLADAKSGNYRKPRDRFRALKFAFSGYSRMIAGSMLLVAFALAAQSTGLLTEEMGRKVMRGELAADGFASDATTDALGETMSVWPVGIAGLFLCLSAFVSGWKMSPFAIVATLVILFGPSLGIPLVGPASAWMVAVAAGTIVYVPGILFGESKED